MDTNQLYLFRDKRFMPLFITQFCGCLNDNVLKNALIILITYKLSHFSLIPTHLLILIVNAIFISPFIIFAGLAGQVADKFERSYLVSIIKVIEIAIVALSVYGFCTNNLMVLLTTIGLMGIHSTFFGPLKYSMLSDQLKKDELLGANGYIEAGTFVSILFGTILGSIINTTTNIVLSLMLIIAIVGLISSFFIPKSNNYNLNLKINYNIFNEILNIIKYSSEKTPVFLSILGISWFWFIGGALLSQIPALTKDTFGADESVVNLFLATFSIGVGIGSFWCNRIFENEITTKYVFIAAIGISIFGVDLFFASRISSVNQEPEQLKSIIVFLSKRHNWRVLLDLLAISTIGGLYVVPLYAVMQYFSSPGHRSRVIAANNVINAIFMIFSTIILSLLFKLECSVPFIILLISLINLVVAGYIYQLLPEVKIIPVSILKSIFKFIFDKVYRVELCGLDNFLNAGKKAVIVSNHISYLDPALLAVYLPERITFAINTSVAKEAWVKPFLMIIKTYSVDPNNSMAVKALIKEVKENKKIVIFPEGRISITGSLMKIYEGPGMIADKADAVILPIRIDGPQYTIFSKLKNLPRKICPKVKITILPPVRIEAPQGYDARQSRQYISHRLYDIMSEMMFKSSDYNKTIFQSLIDTAKIHGFNRIILQDIFENELTYQQVLARSFMLGKLLLKTSDPGEYVGIMLPNSVNTAAVFFACHAYGLVPAMINFTSGISTIISSCKTVKIKVIYTSKKFIQRSGLENLDKELKGNFKVIYLEDLKNDLTLITKIIGLLGGIFPQIYYNIVCSNREGNIPSVVLFTAGTEGRPKAVVLSHSNLQANICQMSARVDFLTSDIAFNTLPMFHTFGLGASILMILSGIKIFFYPSPLNYRIIPEVIYDIGATIMFGTNTFLNNYARYAHPYDFYSLRRIYAGAEKLKLETRKLWFKKHGIRIFEGYGATEASPVISVNTPMHDKPGTVGRLMPGISYHILPVEGIKEGGKLCIKGANIMLGYIFPDNPGVIVAPKIEQLGENWYDTGDIVTIDNEGYITIQDRVKRFAKVAGEMISLGLIEEIVDSIDSNNNHAVVYIDDERKGEQIVLCTNSNIIDQIKLAEQVISRKLSKLYIPKHIVYIQEIPTLMNGKTDYFRVRKIVEPHILQQNIVLNLHV